MESNEVKCVLIQSKVSVEVANKIDEIIEKYGFSSKYELMQYLLTSFLRVVDCESESLSQADEDIVEFARMFEGFQNAKERVITVKPTRDRQMRLTDSINIYSVTGKRGYICKTVSIDGEEVHTNGSEGKALEKLLKKLHPGLYRKLKAIAAEDDETRLERIIEDLVDEHGRSMNEQFISQQFEANTGGIRYGVVPKKKRKGAIDE